MSERAGSNAVAAARVELITAALFGLARSGRRDEALAPLDIDETTAGLLRGGIAQAGTMARDMAGRLVEDHLAAIRETGAGIPGAGARAALLPAEEHGQFLADERRAQDVHAMVASMRYASADEVTGIVAGLRATSGSPGAAAAEGFSEEIAAAAGGLREELLRDPAGYVKGNPDIVAAFTDAGEDSAALRRATQTSLAMQERLGVPEDKRRVLPEAEASAQAARIAGGYPGLSMALGLAKMRPGLARRIQDGWRLGADGTSGAINAYSRSLKPLGYRTPLRS